jgi:hypothetical protein
MNKFDCGLEDAKDGIFQNQFMISDLSRKEMRDLQTTIEEKLACEKPVIVEEEPAPPKDNAAATKPSQ